MLLSFARLGGLPRLCALFLLPVVIAGCVSSGPGPARKRAPDPRYVAMYAERPDEKYPLPAIDISNVDPQYFRQQVPYSRGDVPGTIVVDTQNRFLYLVQEGGMAMRYGIGVGKAGLAFEGNAYIGRKAEWPRWTPTQSMIAREPDRYGPLANGMDPGVTNPLGPRALYLYKDGNDTLFRLHGTTEPWSIGKAVSSGCIRLFNHDIIDLYSRVPTGARVVVLQNEQEPAGEEMSSDPVLEGPVPPGMI